jgi:anti-sigma B factor antagonist
VLELQKTTVEPDVVLVEVSGRLMLGRECQQVEWMLAELLSQQQKKVVFDLSKLEYLDSTGVGIIATCSGKLEASGGELRIACLQPKVEDVMRVTKLHRLMRFYSTVGDALDGFGEPAAQ